MTRLTWDAQNREVESGVNKGVLYVNNEHGVPWNGLVTVVHNSDNAKRNALYLDGTNFSNSESMETYAGAISAFTYPEEFEVCEGSAEIARGALMTDGSRRQAFSLTYQTSIEKNGVEKPVVHLLYNLMAEPTSNTFETIVQNTRVSLFTWDIGSFPERYRNRASVTHVIIDLEAIGPNARSVLEDILYGTDDSDGYIPTIDNLIDIIDNASHITLMVDDHGDGTYSATGPTAYNLPEDTFRIDFYTVVNHGDDTFDVSSGG